MIRPKPKELHTYLQKIDWIFHYSGFEIMSLFSIGSIINSLKIFSHIPIRKLHVPLSSPLSNIYSRFQIPDSNTFRNGNHILQPTTPLRIDVCGMKVVGKPHRRCRDCRLVFIDGVLHNLCSAYGRHTQRRRMPHFKATRIVTHAQQTKLRPWWFLLWT